MTKNPYIGPRAFRLNEQLPNRDREADELTNLLLAERVALLHAPSGAGKTSLIQAAVIHRLRDRAFTPTNALRVAVPVPDGVKPGNRYVFSLAFELLGGAERDPGSLADLRLDAALAQLPKTSTRRVLILDQLEEILLSGVAAEEEKKDFFRQLGDVLADGTLWALLAIREDYLGALDRYLRFLPGNLRARYRLDFLRERDALAAIQKPAESRGVTFTTDAALRLVDKLATAGYVEPFQLQVVCRSVWNGWNDRAKGTRTSIELDDVAEVDIERALGRYYARSMDELEKDDELQGTTQRIVRDWFETELITETACRRQTMSGPVPGELGKQVLTKLEAMYLIRSDERAHTRWYELAHDRLVGAILEDNQGWQLRNLESWQVAAYEWRRKNRRPEFLLPASKLPYAPEPTVVGLLDHERDYLRQSRAQAGPPGRVAPVHERPGRGSALQWALLAATVLELAVIVLLLVGR